MLADLAGRLVLDVHRHRCGDDLVGELAGLLRGGGALLRLQRIFVLRLARDAVAFGDDLGGLDHRHIGRIVHLDQLTVEFDPELFAAHHRNLFEAARDDGVHAVDDDLLGGGGDRHQAG